MNLTRTSFLRALKIGGSVLVIALVAGYSIWRSLDYARGPHISIIEPADWATLQASTTDIRGRIERANSITLNGKDIFIDESGNFSETIAVFPGTNIVTLTAHDQFGRTAEKRLTLTRSD
ncbi:MAG: hypothetical protein AAB365_02895 [Patescibacteria group bacterium]